jgi:hypothetical protein
MNYRNDRVVVEVDGKDVEILQTWKRLCLFVYGSGGIKKRTIHIIKEDLEKLKKEKRK